MTEIYIDKADLNMYQLKPAPPKWDLQEYIVTYLKEKDNRYLAWFLHYYEKTLNNNVQEYMRKLFMPEHFADMWNGRYWTMCALCVQASQHKASQNMPSSVKQWRYGTNTSLIIQMKH